MKRILLRIIVVILAILLADMIMLESLKSFGTNPDPLQMAEETNSPNTNFLYASNASLPGRISSQDPEADRDGRSGSLPQYPHSPVQRRDRAYPHT